MTLSQSRASAARLAVWIAAARPRTLSMAVAPVFVGACLARNFVGQIDLLAVLVAALSAVCIQIGTNLFNDARDFERGGDGPDRLGPQRAAASGLLAPGEVKNAAFGFFALAALGGLFLVAVGGWPILLLGLLSIFRATPTAAGRRRFPIRPSASFSSSPFSASARSAEPFGSQRMFLARRQFWPGWRLVCSRRAC